MILLGTLMVAGAIPLVLKADLFAKKGRAPEATTRALPQTQKQTTVLFVGKREADTSGQADFVAVLSANSAKKSALLLYIPRVTLAEIPGHGLDTLNKTLALGRVPLLATTTSNLLGVRFDGYLEVSDQSLRAIVDKVDGLEIDVERKLTARDESGATRVVFSAGRQHLDGKRVAEYLAVSADTELELSRAVRFSQVFRALVDRYRKKEDASGFADLWRQSKDLYTSDMSAEKIGSLWAGFVNADTSNLVFETLPVKSTSVGEDVEIYSPEQEGIRRLVRQYLADSSTGSTRLGGRVEILNGNGRPGVGQEISSRLVPQGLRIVLNQNAKNFDYEKTQIVIYSDSKQSRELADKVRKTLGVGEILVSQQRQSIVDITIVVGKDYSPRVSGKPDG